MRSVRLFVAAGAVVLTALAAQPLAAQMNPKPPAMPHPAEGRTNCTMCHSGKMPNIAAMPANHADRPVTICLWCHAKDAAVQTKAPAAVPHTLEGRSNCTMCHSGKLPNIPGVPADHAGRDVKYCTLCHTHTGN
jgi:hypothetical protein